MGDGSEAYAFCCLLPLFYFQLKQMYTNFLNNHLLKTEVMNNNYQYLKVLLYLYILFLLYIFIFNIKIQINN